ncbi:leucine-rich repeat-containing protein 15-like [Mizuhopecten yessoensis]|uniref:leucine-rich repeat-containing protein 15-like n=1 Tax=Mizuhopecten yessoensis TaxID=6573 RepID=UPI000B45AB09|nr:leucine-rich repeat-containing protein 15-like [Mizuhopecten yessoensis]
MLSQNCTPNLKLRLDLVKNQLTVLEEDSLAGLPALYTLRLHSQQQGNGLTTIHYNAFKDINGNLTNLWLSDNALTTFPHGVLSEQQYDKLVNVQIDHNRIFNITLYSDRDFPPRTKTIHTKKERAFKLWKSTPYIATLNAAYNVILGISPTDLCGLQYLRDLKLAANTLLNSQTFGDGTVDCLKRLYRIDLSDTSFSLVPTMTDMPNLRELKMNRCDLTALQAGIFGDLQLTHINMDGNKIITVENNVFPPSVIYIFLQSNCFRFTHDNPFTNLLNLKYLHLGHNKIDYIPDTAFHNCTSLRTLLLHRNNIGWLSKGMFKDSPLTDHFYAYDNDISCIEDGTFNHTSRISFLYLYNNKLTRLPMGGDFSSKTVVILQLQNNRFTEIPSGVFEDLTITGSSITTVRSGAFRNTRFGKDFDLRGNPLKTIETGAFDSSTFNMIYLQGNKLTNLTNSVFANASSINGILDLGMNEITTVASEAFDGLTSVSSIFLNDNDIGDYPTAALANLGIKHVNISNNNITELSLVAFRDQNDLVTVNMTGNRVTRLRKGTLSNLANMRTLLLSNNLISYIEPGSFSGLYSVEQIDLADNEIFFFPAMENLTDLALIDLSNNHLKTFEIAAFDELADNKAFMTLYVYEMN